MPRYRETSLVRLHHWPTRDFNDKTFSMRPIRLLSRLLPLLATSFGSLLTASLFLATPAAWAERADRDKPLTLEADNASYDDLKQVYRLSGNVVLTKGSMLLKSDTAEVRIDPEGYQHATAIAKPGEQAYMRQKQDGSNEFIEGYGQRIEYNGKNEVAKLITQARLVKLRGTALIDDIRGDLIVYDGIKEFFTVNSNPASGEGSTGSRVRAVLAPRGGVQSAQIGRAHV